MSEVDTLAGSELTLHLNKLITLKATLSDDLQASTKRVSEAVLENSIIKIKMRQVNAEIQATKYNIRMEQS